MDELISPAELRALLAGANPPIVIDTRDAAAYRAAHIPGALNIGNDRLPRALDRIPKDTLVVTY